MPVGGVADIDFAVAAALNRFSFNPPHMESTPDRRSELLAKELAIALRVVGEPGPWDSAPKGIPYPDPGTLNLGHARFQIDRVETADAFVRIEGWAFDPGLLGPPWSDSGVLVKTLATGWLIFPAIRIRRSDVADHFRNEISDGLASELSGFRSTLPRGLWLERRADFQVVVAGANGLPLSTPLISVPLK